MNTRAKKKLLKEISVIRQQLPRSARTGQFAFLAGLAELQAAMAQEIPAARWRCYGEILDAVQAALASVAAGAEAGEAEEVCSLCDDLLGQVSHDLAAEPAKKDILFLPYKVSMWDSMESVWKAAKEDSEHSNAYVMPIPYANRNPDGSLDQWHCERESYPDDVEALDWQEIDLAAWHPDVIVFHYPYDKFNRITWIPEQYQSEALRACTDKLVYIPYFVLQEITPGDEKAEANISHFILAPGVIHADMVCVQSEDMREAYINVLTKYTSMEDRRYWERKIKATGSPKVDKVLSVRREDIRLPESWRRIIEKPDGSRKKVIFYNVTLSSLEHKDKLLDKMEWVFGQFRERRDEIALLWRPHPLMEEGVAALEPELKQRYQGIVSRYKSEGWGIYDDSEDLHRAIAVSDGYYGDRSSVVSLYQSTGKPIMLQDVNLLASMFA